MFEQNTRQELTSRQKEILSLLRKGLTNTEICKTLGISANTVKVHLANIYKILEVTNRTEAVSANIDLENNARAISDDDCKKDLMLFFVKTNNVESFPKSSSLYQSIIESMHHYHIFRIMDSADEAESGFVINVSASKEKSETLFISVRLGSSHEIIWATSVHANTDDTLLLAQKTTIQLFRNLVLATARMKYNSSSVFPYWWYATAYCSVKLEIRCTESFEVCKKMLTPLISGDEYNEQANYVLAIAYYIAILEKWGDPQTNAAILGEIARKAMFNAPYSIYSKMIMAFYNTTIGNKSEAIAYFEQVIEDNPLLITASTTLIQIFILTGEEEKALKLINKSDRLIPETVKQASIYHSKAFILFLQGKYVECKKIAKQVLLYTPKAMPIRLIMIACCNRLGETEESEFHIKKFFECNPSVSKSDIEQLLLGVTPQKRDFIINSLQNVFPK